MILILGLLFVALMMVNIIALVCGIEDEMYRRKRGRPKEPFIMLRVYYLVPMYWAGVWLASPVREDKI